LLLSASTMVGQSGNGWKEEQNVYAQVHDAPLHLINGQSTSIMQMANQKPLILALIFTRCTGVCNPFILNLKEQLGISEENLDFNLLVVSFDPEDQLPDMKAYARRFNLEREAGWHFGVTSEISALNESIAFVPQWDSVQQQFDHDALLVGINTNGFITRKLLGLRSYRDLGKLVSSMRNKFAPTHQLPNKNVMLSCFNYDPLTGQSFPGLGLAILAIPGLLAFTLVFAIRLVVKK